MRLSSLLTLLVLASLSLPAQERRVRVEKRAIAGEAASGEHHAVWVDGDASQTISIAGPDVSFEGGVVENAAYSAEAVTEMVQTLGDGNRIRRESRTQLYRDSQGRTRREQSLQGVGPWAVSQPQTRVFINDPVTKTQWVLNPAEKTARKMQIPNMAIELLGNAEKDGDATSQVTYFAHDGGSGMKVSRMAKSVDHFKSEQPAAERESLGERMIEGVMAEGERLTTKIPAGAIGNEQEIAVVYERWHSSELQLDVMTKRTDPRFGETTFRLTNIQRAEPLPTLFEPPADYTVEEGNPFQMRRRVEVKRPDTAGGQ